MLKLRLQTNLSQAKCEKINSVKNTVYVVKKTKKSRESLLMTLILLTFVFT